MVSVFINKPVYGTFVYIRKSYLEQAKEEGTDIKIECPGHVCIVNPQKWIDEGQRIDKVFKIPDHPMILWGNHIDKYESIAS